YHSPLSLRPASSAPHLDLPPSANEEAAPLRREWKMTSPYFILHPGATRREKLWEPARWAELIEQLDRNDGLDLVLTSGPSPDEQAHIAAIKTKVQQQIRDLSSTTPLLPLAALDG